jgi:transcriptional regulator with XRE-family HTH domain
MIEMFWMTIEGRLLRVWRKRLGLNQREAAEELGLSESTVSNYEDGRLPVPKVVLLAARAIERGLEPLRAPAPGARELWITLVADMKRYAAGEPVVGELLRARDLDRLGAFLSLVRSGPDPDLAITDPSLFLALQEACTRAHLAGIGKYRVVGNAPNPMIHQAVSPSDVFQPEDDCQSPIGCARAG